jgi:hypothetical protein
MNQRHQCTGTTMGGRPCRNAGTGLFKRCRHHQLTDIDARQAGLTEAKVLADLSDRMSEAAMLLPDGNMLKPKLFDQALQWRTASRSWIPQEQPRPTQPHLRLVVGGAA